MRITGVLWVSLALSVGVCEVARAQDGAAINYREMFLQLDVNADTMIERDEVPEAGRTAFDKLLKLGDTDKDGRLAASELRALGERARQMGALGAGILLQRFKAIDKDGDDKVSRDEFPGPKPLFDRLDSDKDGLLTRDEVAKAQAGKTSEPDKAVGKSDQANPGDGSKPPAPIGASKAETGGFGARLKAMDKDGNGKITRDEFTGPPNRFDLLDADKDGTVTPIEASRLNAVANERFKALDKDDDGKISRDEFPGPRARFQRLDVDGDGFLTRSEAGSLPGSGATPVKKKGA
jgi:Ca2+-binding EF-hand superfamily protein